MKKSKLFIASTFVSLSLIAAQAHATGGVRKPPAPESQVEIQQSQSFSEWLLGLFDF